MTTPINARCFAIENSGHHSRRLTGPSVAGGRRVRVFALILAGARTRSQNPLPIAVAVRDACRRSLVGAGADLTPRWPSLSTSPAAQRSPRIYTTFRDVTYRLHLYSWVGSKDVAHQRSICHPITRYGRIPRDQDSTQVFPEARHCCPDCTFEGTGRETGDRGVMVLVFH
jgi:hypothetical protein